MFRYKADVEEHTINGPYDFGYFYPLGTALSPTIEGDPDCTEEVREAQGGRLLAIISREAVRVHCLRATPEDDQYLNLIAKSYMLVRFWWSSFRLSWDIVMDAMGCNVQHPDFKRLCAMISKNRDTWQNRALDAALDVAKQILTSPSGQANIVIQYKE